MLSIGLVGMHQERYYTDLSSEDYYTEGGEPPGEWFGRGAEQLGLSGTVEKEVLGKLMRGFGPDGPKLVRNAGSPHRRCGMDLTFNAPKSVSVAWSQAQDQSIRSAIGEAHAEAVRMALCYIEENAAQVRLGVQGEEVVQAGVVAATFEHSTARLVEGQLVPDPHLHTHALLVNLGVTDGGRTATLNSRELLRHKMAAGSLYRAELFRQLELRLGLTASRGSKWCELDGIPEELIEHFSKRRRAIEEELERRGGSGALESAEATLRTRSVKPAVDRESFLQAWQEEGRAHGFSLDAKFMEEALRRQRSRDTEAAVREALTSATEKVTAQQSHFAERELVRAASEELEDKAVGAACILEAVRAHLQGPELVRVGEQKGEVRFTTREMLEVERRMLAECTELSRRSHRVGSQALDRVLDEKKFETISKEQRSALLHITQGRAISLVRGVAGTGKTYLLEAARRAWALQGHEVLGCALAATAAKRLEEGSGIKSSSIHRLLWELEQGKRALYPRTILVVDEAAMVGTRQMAELVRHVRSAGAKLVLVGDDRQLQAVDAGGPFASLAARHGAAELNDIRRQRESWAREAVHEFSRGEARHAMKRFVERGLVHVLETRAEAVRQLTEGWSQAVSSGSLAETLVLTGTRSDALRVNREIQLWRKVHGELGERIVLAGEAFHVGDRVLFRKNSKRIRVNNGDFGVVVQVTALGMTVRLDDGARVTVHPDAADEVKPHLGYAATTHASQGATVDRCLVLVGGSMQDQEATYVQASRARVETRIYSDQLSAGEELGGLIREMERSRRKELATDLAERNEGASQELCLS